MKSRIVLPAMLALAVLCLAIAGRYWFIETGGESAAAVISVSIGMPMADVGSRSTIPVRFIEGAAGDGYAEYHDDIGHT